MVAGLGIIVNGATEALSLPTITQAPNLTLGSSVYPLVQTLLGSTEEIVVGTNTLAYGSAITISGHILSFGPSDSVVMSFGHTSTYSFATPEAYITVAPGSTMTAYADTADPSAVVINGMTLRINGLALTTRGETVSLGTSGLVINGTSTIPLTTQSVSRLITSGALILTTWAPGLISTGKVTPATGASTRSLEL